MSENKEPYQWYWAYEDDSLPPFTWIFESREDALDHAIKRGMFDEICCKESMMDKEENMFFELVEYELEDYQPFLIIRSKIAA